MSKETPLEYYPKGIDFLSYWYNKYGNSYDILLRDVNLIKLDIEDFLKEYNDAVKSRSKF